MNSAIPKGNDTLPANDPTDDASRRRSCNDSFVVVHTMSEAGTSRWAPWQLLLTTRLISCGGPLGLALYLMIREPYFCMSHVIHFGATLNFLPLAATTVLDAKGSTNKAFPTVTLLIHGIVSVFSFGLFVTMFARMANSTSEGSAGFIPFIAYFFDVVVIQSRMHLRWRCAVIAWAIDIVGQLILSATRYGSRLSGYNFGGIILVAFIELCVLMPPIAITHIPWCCFTR